MKVLKHTDLKTLREKEAARDALIAIKKEKGKSVKTSDLVERIEKIEEILGIK